MVEAKMNPVQNIVCKRWDARPWDIQELVTFRVRIERETEKAVLLVDDTSKARRSTWVPKKAMKGDRDGCLSAWVYGKLDEARFSETDVFTVTSYRSYMHGPK